MKTAQVVGINSYLIKVAGESSATVVRWGLLIARYGKLLTTDLDRTMTTVGRSARSIDIKGCAARNG